MVLTPIHIGARLTITNQARSIKKRSQDNQGSKYQNFQNIKSHYLKRIKREHSSMKLIQDQDEKSSSLLL